MTGTFIVIDGGEGCGGTAMARAVQQAYPDAVITREPGGSAYAEIIRDTILSPAATTADALTLFLLFWAARADHWRTTIKPALDAGKLVVCDRFDSSTWAYQIAAQGERQLEDLFWTMRGKVIPAGIQPYYIWLDVDAMEGLVRANSRGERLTHFDNRALDFHEKVREGYREFFSKNTTYSVIDANQPIEDVQTQVLSTIKHVMEKEHQYPM